MGAIGEGKQVRGDEVLFASGYDAIVAALAVGLDIRLSTVVSRIEYGSFSVRITADRGTSRPIAPWSHCRSACCRLQHWSSTRRYRSASARRSPSREYSLKSARLRATSRYQTALLPIVWTSRGNRRPSAIRSIAP